MGLLGFFFLVTQIGQYERNGILRFQCADNGDRCSNGNLVKERSNLRIIQQDAAVRLIRDTLCDAMELDQAGHMLTLGNQA